MLGLVCGLRREPVRFAEGDLAGWLGWSYKPAFLRGKGAAMPPPSAILTQVTFQEKEMPLNNDAERLIRANLEAIKNGGRGRLVVIGTLTPRQLEDLNAAQAKRGFEPMNSEVVFIGRHSYVSRCDGDGYTIEDVIQQITWAMHESALIYTAVKMNALKSQRPRNDGYGNQILDKAVLECTGKYPNPELFSVIPIGDKNKPPRKG